MPHRSFLAIWCQVFSGCFILAVVAYGLAPSTSSASAAFSYVLWPGVGLYTALNGSLLFGHGFGQVGNFFLVAVGSALAWSVVIGLLVFVWQRHSEVQGRR